MPEVNFLGEFGGALAVAFGAGCVTGFGFYAGFLADKFRKLFEERSKFHIEEIAVLKLGREEALKHFAECDKTLRLLTVEVAQLKAREDRRDALEENLIRGSG